MLSGNILRAKSRKIAFFDFCETLVNFQTADAFIDFVRRVDGNLYMIILNLLFVLLKEVRIIAVINKFLPYSSIEKRAKLVQLRGFKYQELNKLAAQYYVEKIRPNFIAMTVIEMQRLVQQNYEICLVSAGYSIYLKYFAEEYKIRHILSTEIAFDQMRNRCLGTFAGKDCMHLEKAKRIKAFFSSQDVDFIECISYSDSIADLPMLKLTGKGVVVSRHISQTWVNQYKFREIIWD